MKQGFASGIMLSLVAVAGCGEAKIVSVSGVVKLDGKPYKNAVVSFQPMGSREAPNPGRGSASVTDENGHFTLIYDGERPGALVGRHRVRIFTRLGGEPSKDDGAESASEVKPQRLAEPIPAEWHENSQKEFQVPPGGTNAANFDIETKTAGKK